MFSETTGAGGLIDEVQADGHVLPVLPEKAALGQGNSMREVSLATSSTLRSSTLSYGSTQHEDEPNDSNSESDLLLPLCRPPCPQKSQHICYYKSEYRYSSLLLGIVCCTQKS